MKTGFRYNRQGKASQRPACGFFRWLSFRVGALALLLRKGSLSGHLVWTEDASADALAAGFPSLLAVPEPLFAETAALFPARLRLCAEGTEEELLARIRLVEQRCGLRFDWDAFLAACEKQNRRARRFRALSDALARLAPLPLDARTPHTALRSLIKKGTTQT